MVFLSLTVVLALLGFLSLQESNAAASFAGHTNSVAAFTGRRLTAAYVPAEDEICEEDGTAVTEKDSHYQPGAIDVLYQGNTDIVFTASQVFAPNDAWMSVVYMDQEGNMVCDQQPTNPSGYKRSFKAMCEATTGTANIDLYVHSSDWTNNDSSSPNNPAPGTCASWPSSGVELFSYRLACGACDSCTPPPPTPKEVPFDPEEGVCEGDGVYVNFKEDDYYQEGAVSILKQEETSVTFKVSQSFSDTSEGSLVHVVYQDAADSWTCDGSNGTPLPKGYQRSFKAVCNAETGTAVVDVYVHNSDWTSTNMVNPLHSDRPGECQSWSYAANGAPSSGVALFSYELSCGVCADCTPLPSECVDPMDNPGSSFCPDNQGVTRLGVKGADALPSDIDIVYDITETNTDTVKFKVMNPFPSSLSMFVQYNEPSETGAGGWEDACIQQSVGECGASDQEIVAQCMPGGGTPVTLVQVYFLSTEATPPFVGGAQVDQCCPDIPVENQIQAVAQYSFLIRCECPPESNTARKRNLRGEDKTKAFHEEKVLGISRN